MNNLGNNLPINDANLSQIHAGEEAALDQLDESILEEIEIDDDDESLDETSEVETTDKKKKKVDRSRKRANHSKHQSTKFINKETDIQDLTRHFIQTAADRKKKQVQQKIQNKFIKEYQEDLKESFNKEVKNKYKDQVSLSAMASTHKGQEQERFRKDNESIVSKHDRLVLDENTIQKVGKEKLSAQAHGQNEKQKEFDKSAKQEKMSGPKLQETLNDYVSAFSEDLINEKPEKKEQARVLREKLQSNGFNTKKIRQVEKQVQQHISSDLKKKLKNNFLDVILSYDKKDDSNSLLKNYQTYKTLLDYGEESGILSGENFRADKLKSDAKREVRDFLATELDRTITETKLKTDDPRELIKELDKFNDIAGFVKFNPGEFLKNYMVKINDMGLLDYEWPGQSGVVDTDVSTNSDGSKKDQGQDQNEQEAMGLEVNLEKADDKLRQLYIRQYTKTGIFEAGKLALDIFAAENKVKEAHGSTHLEKIQKEARGVAKLKLVIMLRESYEERATLPVLKGPEFENLDKRFKLIISGLKKAEVNITKSYLKEVRDQANKSMFTLIKEEYSNVEMHLANSPKNGPLLLKRENYKLILIRLKEETQIVEDMNSKFMQDLNFLSDLNIIEAA
jgi:hypothetical protein